MLVFSGNTKRAALQECFDRIGYDSNHERFSANTNCYHVHQYIVAVFPPFSSPIVLFYFINDFLSISIVINTIIKGNKIDDSSK